TGVGPATPDARGSGSSSFPRVLASREHEPPALREAREHEAAQEEQVAVAQGAILVVREVDPERIDVARPGLVRRSVLAQPSAHLAEEALARKFGEMTEEQDVEVLRQLLALQPQRPVLG